MSSGINNNKVPISEKTVLTVQECSALTGIGQNTLEAALSQKNCPFVLRLGRKRLILRAAFDKYLEKYHELKTVSNDDTKDRFDLDVEDIDGNYKLFPDYGYQVDVNVTSLLGHIMLSSESDKMNEKLGKSVFESLKVPEDKQMRYSPDDIRYIDKNSLDAGDFLDQCIAEGKTDNLTGVYAVSDVPSHNLIFSERGTAQMVYVDPLIDAWSRQLDKKNLLITDFKAEKLVKHRDHIASRGYDVKVLDLFGNAGNITFNPLRSAIDAARIGDMTFCALVISRITDCCFACGLNGADHMLVSCTVAYIRLFMYGLISERLDREKDWVRTHGGDPITDDALNEIWSDVTIATCYHMLQQFGLEEVEVTDKLRDMFDFVKYEHKEDTVNGILAYGASAVYNCTDLSLSTLIRNVFNTVLVTMASEGKHLTATVLSECARFMHPCAINAMSGKYTDMFDPKRYLRGDRPTALFVVYGPETSYVTRLIVTLISSVVDYSMSVTFSKNHNIVARGVRYLIDDVSIWSNEELHSVMSTYTAIGAGSDQLFTFVAPNIHSVEKAMGDLKELQCCNCILMDCSDGDTLMFFSEISRTASNSERVSPTFLDENELRRLKPGEMVAVEKSTNRVIRSRFDMVMPPFMFFNRDEEVSTYSTMYPPVDFYKTDVRINYVDKLKDTLK